MSTTPHTAPRIPDTLADLATPIDDLHPYDRNPRRGSIELIAESLNYHGQYRPIVVRANTHQVLAGNHTLAAAKHLGWTHIAATWVDCDDDQAARIVLVDNRANDVAGYDDIELLQLLNAIPGFEGTGFDQDALNQLQADIDAAIGDPVALTDPDDVPVEPTDPISTTGDVWLLGPHRLAVGDGTDAQVVAAATGGRPADLYVSDPPYNVAYVGKTADALTIDNDNMGDPEFAEFLTALFAAAATNTKPGGPAYVFHADTAGVAFRRTFEAGGWDLKQVLVWVKNTMVLGRQDHQWQHEPILYGWRPGAAHAWYGGRSLTTLIADDQPDPGEMSKRDLVRMVRDLLEQSTVLRADKPARNAWHPTMKPVALLERILERSSRVGELALDTCGGSGSTLIAAHRARRVAALVEVDPVYADVICRRYQEHTGTSPVLEATGEAFDFTPSGQGAA